MERCVNSFLGWRISAAKSSFSLLEENLSWRRSEHLDYLLESKFYFETQVTGVGVNTEWGLLMATVSEDNGGETPLQVSVNLLSVHISFWHLLLNIHK